MTARNIGRQYDKIAAWWNEHHKESSYGAAQLERALSMAAKGGRALDVGCGSGGRLIRSLEARGFEVTGLDASEKMIALAQENHPSAHFIHDDICNWESRETFDFILAWDSLFHLPLNMQQPVLSKLCQRLSKGGVMIHTFGDDTGEHKDRWRGQDFYYSSIGVQQNIEILHDHHLSILHLERDQYPERHIYMISKKVNGSAI